MTKKILNYLKRCVLGRLAEDEKIYSKTGSEFFRKSSEEGREALRWLEKNGR